MKLLKKISFKFGLFGIKTQKKTIDKYFGVVVTEIIKRKHGKVCHVYIVTGRQMSKWQHLINRVEEFAKDEGCKMMELIARPGWQKVYNNHGYKKTHVVLEKQIKQEDNKNVK
jgi:histone acetyltransferase (RNA polymerase elongator complex component)